MEDLAWGGDYQGEALAQYFVDDYLLFPEFPRHSSHLMPDVAQTWRPFFRRTLQALRGESPQNAARWLGTFLHFVEDSGSPPHALPLSGVVHTRMENYVLGLHVRLNGYQPREFPHDEVAAEAAMVSRMGALVAFSRERAERLRPLAERDDRLACEPLILECAQETMRAVADVTHSLLVLAAAGPRPGTAVLRGEIRASADPAFPQTPARVLLERTGISTVADPGPRLPGDTEYRAGFVLGDLPPDTYTVWFVRAGCRTVRKRVRLAAGERRTLSVRLPNDFHPGNRVRNADLQLRWLRPNRPDHWTFAGGAWLTDAFPIVRGGRYVAGARDAAGARRVRVRVGEDPRLAGLAAAQGADPNGEALALNGRYARLEVEGESPPLAAWVAPAADLKGESQ